MQTSKAALVMEYCDRTVANERLLYHVLFIILLSVVGYLSLAVMSHHGGDVSRGQTFAFIIELMIYVLLANAFAVPAVGVAVDYRRGEL